MGKREFVEEEVDESDLSDFEVSYGIKNVLWPVAKVGRGSMEDLNTGSGQTVWSVLNWLSSEGSLEKPCRFPI